MLLRPTKVPQVKCKNTTCDAIDQRDIFVPNEIVEHIVDLVRDDKQILLSLGGVSNHLLSRTRHILFSTLQVSDGKKFDEFLEIMDVPWSSFTSAVQRIRVEGVFDKWGHSYKTGRNLSRIADNLRKATVLQLKPIGSWVLAWHYIDPTVLSFMSHLHVKHFELSSTGFIMPHHIGYLFKWIPPSMESFAFYDLKGEAAPVIGDGSTTFTRPLHFTVLDHRSLKLWLHIWGSLSTPPDMSVETLHIRPYMGRDIERRAADDEENLIPLISKFLHHVGSSIQSLFVGVGSWTYHEIVCKESVTFFDLSPCRNLRTIYIGLDELATKQIKMVSKTLSTLPSPDSLQDIYVGFEYGVNIDHRYHLESLVEFLHYLRNMFQNVKKIGILINPKYLKDDQLSCIDKLRGSERLQKLEEGPLEFHFVETDVDLLKSPWKEMAGRGD
ncbi:hypothetical protein JOM56_011960 [Amanita muscaria]